ncbi:unnamed protein product [Amoebophrya sp. A120]|nr:unnamed protein product [Amoebophrya sp. A120]|eukprot:GSA120T00006516001.1
MRTSSPLSARCGPFGVAPSCSTSHSKYRPLTLAKPAANTVPSTAASTAPESVERCYFSILYSAQPYQRKRKCFLQGLLVVCAKAVRGEDGQRQLKIVKTEIKNDKGDTVRQFRSFATSKNAAGSSRGASIALSIRFVEDLRAAQREVGGELGYHCGMFLELGDEVSEADYLSGQMFLPVTSAAPNVMNKRSSSSLSLQPVALGPRGSAPTVSKNMDRHCDREGVRAVVLPSATMGAGSVESSVRAPAQDEPEAKRRRVLLPLKKRQMLGRGATTTAAAAPSVGPTSGAALQQTISRTNQKYACLQLAEHRSTHEYAPSSDERFASVLTASSIPSTDSEVSGLLVPFEHPEKIASSSCQVGKKKEVSSTSTAREQCANDAIPQVAPCFIDRKTQRISVDAELATKLRPHQLDALYFLYDRLYDGDVGVGVATSNNVAAIFGTPASSTSAAAPRLQGVCLADDMGLGKSLTTIAFMYSMIQAKVLRKACIVCPASLTSNWQKEICKWLGERKLRPTVIIGNSHTKRLLKNQTCSEKMEFVIKAWVNSKNPMADKLLILSYEQLRNHADALALGVDFLVLDEGHRIGSGGSQTATSLHKFRKAKKLLLSGTPLQNNLDEFFALSEFLNPGLLGYDYEKVFKKPILKARDKHATTETKKLGDARFHHMNMITQQWLLRRTANMVLRKVLPPMHTLLLFCPLSLQFQKLYTEKLMGAAPSTSFGTTNTAGRGAPSSSTASCDTRAGGGGHGVLSLLLELRRICFEGKMEFVKAFLRRLSLRQEKCVLVSNFTRCLDHVERVLQELAVESRALGTTTASFNYERLDGSTSQKLRGPMVERFNRIPDDVEGSFSVVNSGAKSEGDDEEPLSGAAVQFFLLSAKAGGVGLNLIGGAKLVMLDPDWNPATDAQAMRRVWRDGQKREVFVYRLVTPGSIEECILMRQDKKQDLLQNVVVSADALKKSHTNLTLAEVRHLFQLRGYSKPKAKAAAASIDKEVEVEPGAAPRWQWKPSEYVRRMPVCGFELAERACLLSRDDEDTSNLIPSQWHIAVAPHELDAGDSTDDVEVQEDEETKSGDMEDGVSTTGLLEDTSEFALVAC